MDWLKQVDVDVFRWVNLDLANKPFDLVMPLLSGNQFFFPAVVVLALGLVWKGRIRGLFCVLCLLLAVALTDGFVVSTVKNAIARPRPFIDIPEARCLLGKGASGSMPSAHAANWFAAAVVAFVYYRRSAWFLLPLALLVAFSRVYNGVHYPSDVLIGAVIGAGCGASALCLLQWSWRSVGTRWFPLWWERLPSLVNPPEALPHVDERDLEPVFAPRKKAGAITPQPTAPGVTLDQQWARLGYIVIVVLLIARWFYIGSGTIELSEDEAYQWVWSKHPALSYYSKPPLIAYTQFLGTHLWGDNEFGIRFFSPLISAILGLMVLRFFTREVNARAGFALLLAISAAPLMAAGSVLMTIDPLSVLFWTAAMLSGWRAVQDKGSLVDWLWVGVWMGLGFLSKYTQLFQLLCWVVFFTLWPAARKQLHRPGPYLALAINAVMALPVLIWNAQHDWITVTHVADNAGAGNVWQPTLRFFLEFVGSQLGLLNPVFFIALVWAAVAFWRTHRRNPRMVYLFSMGAPLFLCYLLFTFKSRVFPNWIAPSVVPLFCLMVIYWDARARLGTANVRPWFFTGLLIGLPIILLLHDTNLAAKLTGFPLPTSLDPLRRVRGWSASAKVVEQAREELLKEGKPVFVIGHHYGLTGELSFYMPEAKTNIKNAPLVYYVTSATPRNQFFFLPGYTERKGENALFVRDMDAAKPASKPPPAVLQTQFESVTDLGIRPVFYRKGKIIRQLQFYVCRGLK